IAHTVAAALVALAVLAFVRFLEHPSVRWAFAAVLGLAFAIAVRNEAVLLSMALSATVVTLALRPIRMRRLVLGLATGAFSVLAFLLDAAISRSVFGAGGVSIPAGSEEEIGFVVGRVAGATTTLLAPAYNQGEPLTTLLLVLILILGAYAALVVGSRRSDREIARVVRGVSYMVLVATALRLISRREPDIVPGLLMAFPIGVWGLCLTARMRLRDDRLRLLAAGAGLFVALVLVLQYNEGGGWEWGGRYFAIALPLVGPLAGLGLVRGWERLAESARLPALLATCAVGAVLFVIGVGAVGDTRRLNGDLVDSTLAMTAGMETADEMAVIVSTERELPRLGYAHLDEARWLLAEPELLPDLVELLHESGVEEFVLATLRPREVAASFEQSPYELDRPLNDATEDGNGWWLTVAATR
ncbi:MAG: hypothetical protein GY946_01755, partial [bacterium]|nr:hypothetical protein [bacterium]